MAYPCLLQLLERRTFLSTTAFGVIGDFGYVTVDGGANEAAVANMVKSWNPEYILTVGDNNYQTGSAGTIDQNIGRDYHEYMYNYPGGYGAGSPTRRFFPTLGNHDWGNVVPNPSGANPYLNYFDLPGNERYYDFVQGPVHFFAIDSDYNEPDGNTASSVQAQWLQQKLATATEPHKIVYFHHAPYSSGDHGNSAWMQWPFASWGATGVFTGHEHSYQRLIQDGIPYFVNGLGGAEKTGLFTPIPGTMYRFNSDFGAMRVRADDTVMRYQFFSVGGILRDQYNQVVGGGAQQATVSLTVTDGLAGEGGNRGQVVLSRTGSAAASLSIALQISGTASNGADYSSLSGTVTFPEGSSTLTLDINPIDDGAVEASESVQITIAASDDYNYDATKQTGKVTIADNDVYSTTLIPAGSGWRHLVTSGTPSNWNGLSFVDSSWGSGNTPMGYGDPGMATTLGWGPDSNNKYITTYFRKSFIVPNSAAVSGLDLFLRRDDGAVIYLNGTEVARSNMPGGTVTWATLASTAVADADETAFFKYSIPPSALTSGMNLLAVEIHQNAGNSSDLAFDLRLVANLDVVAPSAPSAPLLLQGGNLITHPAGVPTNFATLHLTGDAEPGDMVQLFSGSELIGSGVSDGAGRYDIVTAVLSESLHLISARAIDAAGNAGGLSDSTPIVIDLTAPTVLSVEKVIHHGPATLRFHLSEEVQDDFDAARILIRNRFTGETFAPMDVSFLDEERLLLIHLSRDGRTIADGHFEVIVPRDQLVDEAGNVAADDAVAGFSFLAGDTNDDDRVDTADFNALAGGFGRAASLVEGDLNFTGRVDSTDFNLLLAQYGKRVGDFASPLFSSMSPFALGAAHPEEDDSPENVEFF